MSTPERQDAEPRDIVPDLDSTIVRAVVVDDEPAAREVVITMLAEFSNVRVVGEASNGRDAVTLIRSMKPDLLFLDIQMPDEDGFRVLERLGEDVPRGVVFVTAHDEHAIRAFDVHALDYLLKPFGRPRFRAAAGRALERLKAMDALTLTRTLSSMADDRRADQSPAGELDIIAAPAGASPAPLPQRIGVRTGSKVAVIEVDTIDWVEALGDYARVHVGKGAHVVSQRMHALEQMLEAGGFVRIHRSLIVHLKRVRELHRESDGSGSVVLDSGVRLRVARGRWQALLGALGMPEF
ncbi:MAG: LytTR family DNA-binding domain-containing protein [Gemmatimonadaceae bacterium]